MYEINKIDRSWKIKDPTSVLEKINLNQFQTHDFSDTRSSS